MQEAERQQMQELQGEAEDLAARPNMRKAAAMQGYWVPNGVGYNHKKPKGQGEVGGWVAVLAASRNTYSCE
jgi:hypothetical protein